MASSDRNRRLYCLVSDLDTARAAANDLWQAGVGWHDVGVVTRREMLVADLPEAGIRERSAVVEAAKRGLVIGAAGGAITGLVAAIELPVDLMFAYALVLFGGVAGSAFGIWVSAMMSLDHPHREVRPYQHAIDAGRVLLIIHVHREQAGSIERLIRQRYPAATLSTAAGKAAPR